jgi:hypothetical protein
MSAHQKSQIDADSRRRQLAPGVTAKDLILAIIGRIGTAGGTGYAIEFGGNTGARIVDGRADDDMQYVDRSRRARRDDCRRRTDARLHSRTTARAGGRNVAIARRRIGARS